MLDDKDVFAANTIENVNYLVTTAWAHRKLKFKGLRNLLVASAWTKLIDQELREIGLLPEER